MTKEQIESMIVDDMVVIICQNPEEKLETFNLIAENLGVPLGPCAAKSIQLKRVEYKDHLAVGFMSDDGIHIRNYITSWRTNSTMVKDREKIRFDEFAELIRNTGEDVGGTEDTSIEEEFMRLLA